MSLPQKPSPGISFVLRMGIEVDLDLFGNTPLVDIYMEVIEDSSEFVVDVVRGIPCILVELLTNGSYHARSSLFTK